MCLDHPHHTRHTHIHTYIHPTSIIQHEVPISPPHAAPPLHGPRPRPAGRTGAELEHRSEPQVFVPGKGPGLLLRVQHPFGVHCRREVYVERDGYVWRL
ncbi:uncharacterized protein TRIREDRAFT_123616 [Trichoderma reesei QM6a]|uniref:Predicted protein n=2 Tax=Hypocrea jecorina TaxID=51453 RepID=G0RTN9_HYPJQ|nr:uncharacterized protein TRIREDRAFT_123616 [Trichoderma reesei QM6a]EGR45465.1 predicted protein [Trichoderma reesei QM6a]ETR98615.1 hypothetical protein M419DRAFT_124750 [Trichoderma reesei RUT C-30]